MALLAARSAYQFPLEGCGSTESATSRRPDHGRFGRGFSLIDARRLSVQIELGSYRVMLAIGA